MDACQPRLNDGKTEQLAAVHETCCSCIPQRLGTILLALIKLMLSFGVLLILFDILHVYNLFGHPILLYDIIIWISIMLDVVDIVIAMVVVISVCLKNRKVMKMYYIYSICVFGALTFMSSVTVFITTVNVVVLLIFFLVFLLILMIQEGLNQSVKKELQELESREQFLL